MFGDRKRLLALFLLAPATLGWSSPANTLALQPQSRLWVEGTSTVRGYECSAKSLHAQVATTGPGATSAVLAGQPAVTAVSLRVPARQLDCANGTMNEHMLRALKADAHPEIRFTLASYELADAAQGVRVALAGTLAIGGVERPVTLQADAREAGGGALRVTGSHTVLMTEFGLRPPTLMMGTLKVNERVNVKFDLILGT